jgi:phosphomannomutase
MRPLKIGISGVRGIVGESLTPELVVSFAQAFATYLDSGRILVCRDTRSSGPMVQAAVVSGLLSAGCEVIDLGVSPTPTLQLAVRWLGAGEVSITSGHNPARGTPCSSAATCTEHHPGGRAARHRSPGRVEVTWDHPHQRGRTG